MLFRISDGHLINCEDTKVSVYSFGSDSNCNSPIKLLRFSPWYVCWCEAGWSGVNCEIDIDYCTPETCIHGGECIDDEATYYYCDYCDEGWSGTLCDYEIDDCDPNPCANGDCTDVGNGFDCSCVDDYAGAHCDQFSPCNDAPCVHGECRATAHDPWYECICSPDYEGVNCDIEIEIPQT